MATESHGAGEDRISVPARRAALRTVVSAMFPDGFNAEKLTLKGRAEVRAGIDAVLVLYDDLVK